MSETIQVLLIVLLVVSIAAVIKLFLVLNGVQATLSQTRAEIAGTLAKVEVMTSTTDKLMREELTPTLQVTRQALGHVEVMTRALAETTSSVRGISRKAEGAATIAAVVGGGGGTLAKTAFTLAASGVMAFIRNRKTKADQQKKRERTGRILSSKK